MGCCGGVDPETAYAALKCGFTVTDENHELFTDEQLSQWDAAIAEFRRKGGCDDS